MEISLSGWRPLHAAVYSGSLDATKLILEAGAEIDALDRHNRSPLHIALIADVPVTILRALMDVGADPFIRDDNGTTPFSLSQTMGEEVQSAFSKHFPTDYTLRSTVTLAANSSESSPSGKLTDNLNQNSEDVSAIAIQLQETYVGYSETSESTTIIPQEVLDANITSSSDSSLSRRCCIA